MTYLPMQKGSTALAEFEVIIEQTAEQDLFHILSYISDILREPSVAKRIYFSIKKQVLSLERMPYRCVVVSEEPYAQLGSRKIPVENYTAFYFVDDENKTVHVFRILYNRRE